MGTKGEGTKCKMGVVGRGWLPLLTPHSRSASETCIHNIGYSTCIHNIGYSTCIHYVGYSTCIYNIGYSTGIHYIGYSTCIYNIGYSTLYVWIITVSLPTQTPTACIEVSITRQSY